MTRTAAPLAALLLVLGAGVGFAQAVQPDHTATVRADSLRLSGRPWHAAETLLAAARRDPNPNAFLIVEGAKAEVHARRYAYARSLLVNQPGCRPPTRGARGTGAGRIRGGQLRLRLRTSVRARPGA